MFLIILQEYRCIKVCVILGQEVHGVPEWVITGGRVVVEEGHVKVARGAGSYVVTPPFSPYVYDRVKEAEIALAKRNMPVIRTPEVFFINIISVEIIQQNFYFK